VAPNANFIALEAKVFRKSHGLRSAGPEDFCPFHDCHLMSDINDIYHGF
jgi:hypothetical protein